MEEYLMIMHETMHEVEKARLNRRTPRVHQKERPCRPADEEQATKAEEERDG